MGTSTTQHERPWSVDRRFVVGIARAIGGAALFALPLLMTQEMWSIGIYIDRLRLALLLVCTLPLLVGLSHFSGFEETFDAKDDFVDALVALAVGFVSGTLGLVLIGQIAPGMSLDEMVGKISLQAIPGSMGALLAQSQFGGNADQREREDARRPSGYGSQLFVMATGALFLAFNIAPTGETLLIGYTLSAWQLVIMMLLSLASMHAFVYALEFWGQERVTAGTPWWSPLLRYTVAGYALTLAICAYVLWTFGRLDSVAPYEALTTIIVLGLPGALGAAAARLIL